jgi:hypothetical protein
MFAFLFGLVYIFYYERHGDTVFYWQGALKLNELFFNNPMAYFNELFSSGGQTIPNYYKQVGNPPSWIYSEGNSWFVCKVANFISFFTFGSYITLNLFFSAIVAWVSWRFFLFVRNTLNSDSYLIALACLFVPTTAFWCSGVSKDAIILCAVFGTVISFFNLMNKTAKSTWLTLFVLVFCFYLLLQVRPFMLLITYLPILIILTFRLNKDKAFVTRFMTRVLGFVVTLAIIVLYLNTSTSMSEFSADKIFQQAQVIQGDLMNNEGYTGNRYDLGLTDFSGAELIKVIPSAINAALFRPYLWDGSNPLILVSGLENLLVLLFSCWLLFKLRRKENRSFNKESTDFVLYSMIFTLFLAYVVGITSVLFGVLVRFKAPIIPFFLLFLISKTISLKKE